MAHLDRDEVLKDAFEEPQKATNDMGSFEAHKLPDLIAADKYLKASGVGKPGSSTQKFLGMMVKRFSFPGSIN